MHALAGFCKNRVLFVRRHKARPIVTENACENWKQDTRCSIDTAFVAEILWLRNSSERKLKSLCNDTELSKREMRNCVSCCSHSSPLTQLKFLPRLTSPLQLDSTPNCAPGSSYESVACVTTSSGSVRVRSIKSRWRFWEPKTSEWKFVNSAAATADWFVVWRAMLKPREHLSRVSRLLVIFRHFALYPSRVNDFKNTFRWVSTQCNSRWLSRRRRWFDGDFIEAINGVSNVKRLQFRIPPTK